MCKIDLLEVVIVAQLLSGHDAILSGKEGHARLPGNSPLLHTAIRFTRMVDKASNGSSSGINDHVLVKVHQVVALPQSQ